ncbi:hypothetical protein [Blastococcus litoris]|uniref:hypothetical protein n=1 Tax=Blastococcus litoris TaxID=2171622 RepID=UPI000E3034C8|nr:hypothetical protein [Blastococcus litoris]
MTSSDPQPPDEPGRSTPPSTQEIPVVKPATGATAVQLPPHPGATTPAPVQPVEAAAPTGPVDFVPGLPGLGTPPPPPPVRPAPVIEEPATEEPEPLAAPSTDPAPAAATGPAPAARSWPDTLESETATGDRPRRTRVRAPRDRATLVGAGLGLLSLVLLELGLTMGSPDSYWQDIPLWSGFATLCAVLGLGAFVAFVAARERLRAGLLWRIAAAGLVGLAVFWLLVVLPVVATDRGFVLTAALAALGGALWVGPRGDD